LRPYEFRRMRVVGGGPALVGHHGGVGGNPFADLLPAAACREIAFWMAVHWVRTVSRRKSRMASLICSGWVMFTA
jgi:hypothetical protein